MLFGMSNITDVLAAIEKGEPSAAENLLPLVYEELRKLAAARLAQERPGQTLQPTALVHEAYLRVAGTQTAQRWDGKHHFFAAAAEAMRRILIDQARQKAGPRRGGNRKRIDANLDLLQHWENIDELLDVNEAVVRLEAESPPRAQLVKLRFFAGLTTAEAAEVMKISVATADRYWTYARTWLYANLHSPDDKASDD